MTGPLRPLLSRPRRRAHCARGLAWPPRPGLPRPVRAPVLPFALYLLYSLRPLPLCAARPPRSAQERVQLRPDALVGLERTRRCHAGCIVRELCSNSSVRSPVLSSASASMCGTASSVGSGASSSSTLWSSSSLRYPTMPVGSSWAAVLASAEAARSSSSSTRSSGDHASDEDVREGRRGGSGGVERRGLREPDGTAEMVCVKVCDHLLEYVLAKLVAQQPELRVAESVSPSASRSSTAPDITKQSSTSRSTPSCVSLTIVSSGALSRSRRSSRAASSSDAVCQLSRRSTRSSGSFARSSRRTSLVIPTSYPPSRPSSPRDDTESAPNCSRVATATVAAPASMCASREAISSILARDSWS